MNNDAIRSVLYSIPSSLVESDDCLSIRPLYDIIPLYSSDEDVSEFDDDDDGDVESLPPDDDDCVEYSFTIADGDDVVSSEELLKRFEGELFAFNSCFSPFESNRTLRCVRMWLRRVTRCVKDFAQR